MGSVSDWTATWGSREMPTWLKCVLLTIFALLLIGVLGPFVIIWYQLIRDCNC